MINKYLIIYKEIFFNKKRTTVTDCFGHCKFRLGQGTVIWQQVGEDEGIRELDEVIFGLHYKNMIDIESLLNYPSENDTLMESFIDEEIIQV